VPLDGALGVVTHGLDDRVPPVIRMDTCEIRKKVGDGWPG
jgi:hypothetical protein